MMVGDKFGATGYLETKNEDGRPASTEVLQYSAHTRLSSRGHLRRR